MQDKIEEFQFGVVMPTLNQGAFIRKAIISLLSQTGALKIDLFIVDGGSTDNTLFELEKIAREIEQKDLLPACLNFSMRWISEPDKGQSDAINKGFMKVQGQILSWLNSDDFLCPGSLQRVLDTFSDNPECDVVVGSARALDEFGNERWIQVPRKPTIATLLVDGECPPQPSIFWRAQLRELGSLDVSLRYTMDFELWIRFVLAEKKFLLISDILSEQVLHSSCKSMEGAVPFEKFQPEIKMIKMKYRNKAILRYSYAFFRIYLLFFYTKSKFLLFVLCRKGVGFLKVRLRALRVPKKPN